MPDSEFVPKFSHLGFLLIMGVVFAVIASLMSGLLQTVLFVAGGLFFIMGYIWNNILVAERVHARDIAEQYSERENLLAVARAFESTKHLPPAAALLAMDRLMPGKDFAGIVIPPEGIQKHESDNWDIQKTIPGGLAKPEQYRTLANEFFGGKGRGAGPEIPIRYWTEKNSETGRASVFTRTQLETILGELRMSGLADKNANGETSLNDDGKKWLRRYYLPVVDGYTPI